MPSCADAMMINPSVGCKSMTKDDEEEEEVAEYIASLRGLVVCEVAACLLPVQPVEELLFEKAVRAGGGV